MSAPDDFTRHLQRLRQDPQAVARAAAAAGQPVTGYVGSDAPVALILAGGALPVRLRATPGTPDPRIDDFVESSFAPELRAIAAQWLGGALDHLQAVVFSRSDDSGQAGRGKPSGGATGRRAAEHRTGDLARIEPDGRIVLVGRTRDMIIRGTTNIYPGLFEPRIAALDGAGEAVLVGVPQVDGDERVVLVVTSGAARVAPHDDVVLDPDHPLVGHVRAALPGVVDHDALPDVVLHADRVPLSGRSRKPDRQALARAAAPFVTGPDARPAPEPAGVRGDEAR